MRRRRPGRGPLGGVALVAALAAAAGAGGGLAFHQLRASSAQPARAAALPELHWQAVWAAGRRAAPAVTLRDQSGARVSLAALRGRPVLLTFMDSQCRAECPIEGRQLGAILRRLPVAQRPTLVVVGVNPTGDTPRSIRHATRTWALGGPWRWHWLRGTRAQLAPVWRAYEITVDPRSADIAHSLVLYLIDARGFERTAYLYPFLPGFVQRDLGTLAAEPAA